MSWLNDLQAITLDFGNTLVPVDRPGLRRVVERTAAGIAERSGPFEVSDFLAAWAEERDRQFAEALPQFREVDLRERVIRVLARLRGALPPGPTERWDDEAARDLTEPAEVDAAIDRYSRSFVDAMPPPPEAGRAIRSLAARYRLAILSNWPLALTIDRYAEAAGWAEHLTAVVVSERVGTIKPHPAIFAAARVALGDPAPGAILHAGDDPAADVEGAQAAGWRAALVRSRPADSPLPTGEGAGAVRPDLTVNDVSELDRALP